MAKIISDAKKKGMYLVMSQAMKNIKMPMVPFLFFLNQFLRMYQQAE